MSARCSATAADHTPCELASGHDDSHACTERENDGRTHLYTWGGDARGATRAHKRQYPAKLITMPADMWTRLDEIAVRWGTSRSATLARLVRESVMPRRLVR